MSLGLHEAQHIEVVIVETKSLSDEEDTISSYSSKASIFGLSSFKFTKPNLNPILTNFHAGYFQLSLSLCSQALLWKALGEPLVTENSSYDLLAVFKILPSTSFTIFWCVLLLILGTMSLLYLLRCIFHFEMVKAEFLDHIGVNYLFAPSISWLLLLQSSPFLGPTAASFRVLWWVFIGPILLLDVKIYGQWFTKGKRFLSTVANPSSQLSVIGNLVAARAAALTGWTECAIFMFSLGITHYLVIFVTLYQRMSGSKGLPVVLRPVFFLFIAAPSMASLVWDSITGKFDDSSKMLFYLSMFLFLSLVTRPYLFKKSMRKFSVAWWAYPFPLTVLALASVEYALEVKGSVAHWLMISLATLSVFVSIVITVYMAINIHVLQTKSITSSPAETTCSSPTETTCSSPTKTTCSSPTDTTWSSPA